MRIKQFSEEHRSLLILAVTIRSGRGERPLNVEISNCLEPLANSVTLNLSPKHSISFLKIKNGNDDNNTELKVLS